MDVWAVRGMPLRSFWGVLGFPWGGFRYARGILDASWVYLGGVLRDFKCILGRWEDLEAS